MYAPLALLAVLSTWVFWQWATDNRSREDAAELAWPVSYTFLLLAGLYTHYFFPIIILAHGILVALYLFAPQLFPNTIGPQADHRWLRITLGWGSTAAIAVLGYVVWVPVFLRQIGGRAGTSPDLMGFLAESGKWLGVGDTLPLPTATLPLIAGAILILLGILVSARKRAVLPLVMTAVPFGGSFLVGATDPAFFKFLLTIIPFLCILAALSWQLKGWLRVIPMVLTVVVIAGSSLSLHAMYTDPAYARADYRGMAARIATEAHPNAAIILDAPNQWEVFTYYHRDGAPVFPLPEGSA
ncbi:MAG: hypothetical protein R3C44_09240 [Chloroflexota bacterium]